MNPFDLYGPEFLVFYAVFTVLVVLVVSIVRDRMEAGPPPAIDLSDPYLVSYLRGGTPEVLRTATITLIDRKLLDFIGDSVVLAKNTDVAMPQADVEKAVLRYFANSSPASSVFNNAFFNSYVVEYDERLTELDLRPNAQTKSLRWTIFLIAALVLCGSAY